MEYFQGIGRRGTALIAVSLFVPKALESDMSYRKRLAAYYITSFVAADLSHDLSFELD